MNRGLHGNPIGVDEPEENRPEERIDPSPPKGLVQRIIPSSSSDRRRVNIVLLAGVIPLLLIGIALTNIFIPSVPATPDIMLERAGQTVQATEMIIGQRLETTASIASDPLIASADTLQHVTQQRLNDYLSVFNQFDGLAVLDQNGDLLSSAGTLPPGPQIWAAALPYQAGGTTAISPYSPPQSLPTSGTLTFAGSIERQSGMRHLLFTAVTEGSDDTGVFRRTVVGFTDADTILESANLLMYGQGDPNNARNALVQDLAYTLETPEAQPQIRLVSLRESELDIPGTTMTGGFTEPTVIYGTSDGTGDIYRRVSAPNGISLPWYLLLRVQSSTDGLSPFIGNLSLTMATLAVLLTLVACWGILRSNQSQPQQPVAAGQADLTQTMQASPEAESNRSEISQRLVAVQESVRREMADYIHGHVQSKLLALSMSLGMCQQVLEKSPDEAQDMLVHIQNELHKVYDVDLRQVSQELYPSIVKMGLIPGIRSLVNRFEESLDMELVIDPAVKELDLSQERGIPEKQRLGIYRIAEEALTNTFKHSRASKVLVSLKREGDAQLVLSVVDDGDGFDQARVHTSQGLVMIADYASAIGGRTEIISAPKLGTTIRVIIDLN